MKQAILAYAVKYQGDWSKIAQAISNEEKYEPVEVLCDYFTIVDEQYPESFRKLRFPPWIIFYAGDLSLLNRKTMGIVGSRKMCLYAQQIVEQLCIYNRDKVIVSGLAKGVDAKAHQSSLLSGTIGILGCGLDVAYPKENYELIKIMKSDHLILTEYPLGTKPLKHHFPWRNRLIAALSDIVVAVQAEIKSGTSTTIMHAIELSKSVYCVPYPLTSSVGQGCNHLISQGAQILLSAEENL